MDFPNLQTTVAAETARPPGDPGARPAGPSATGHRGRRQQLTNGLPFARESPNYSRESRTTRTTTTRMLSRTVSSFSNNFGNLKTGFQNYMQHVEICV